MHEPVHPYKRLLLNSIPQPDPDQRWTDRIGVDDIGAETGAEASLVTAPEDSPIL